MTTICFHERNMILDVLVSDIVSLAWFKSWSVMSRRHPHLCQCISFSGSLCLVQGDAMRCSEGLEGTCLFDKQMT